MQQAAALAEAEESKDKDKEPGTEEDDEDLDLDDPAQEEEEEGPKKGKAAINMPQRPPISTTTVARVEIDDTSVVVTPEAVYSLVDMMCAHPSLMHVDLSGLGLGDDGACQLGTSLTHLTPLASLSSLLLPSHPLHANSRHPFLPSSRHPVIPNILLALWSTADILEGNATLAVVRLQSNHITGWGGEFLMRALGNKPACIFDCPALNCTRGIEVCYLSPTCVGADLSFSVEGHAAVARLRYAHDAAAAPRAASR